MSLCKVGYKTKDSNVFQWSLVMKYAMFSHKFYIMTKICTPTSPYKIKITPVLTLTMFQNISMKHHIERELVFKGFF
jgi:hypothetical protein